jgi:hypothetical protein
MRHTARLLWSTAIVVAAMTACGGPAKSPVAKTRAQVFPLTITRTGGIAGFSDTLVITDDGLVMVAQKGRAPWSCRLAPGTATRLRLAASEVPWPRLTPASTGPSFPDDLVTTARSPAGGPVRLEDPLIGATGTVFNELVNDLRSGRSASGMCQPL